MSKSDQIRKARTGTYYEPMPVDFLILEALPEQGMLGGVRWLGRRVKDVTEEINAGMGDEDESVPSSFIAGRIVSMAAAGYVRHFIGRGGKIWARTPQGSAYMATKEEVLGI